MIPPSKIREVDYDLLIIEISGYEKEIKNDLIQKYGVDEKKIATYQPEMLGIKWEEERVVMLKKCISLMKERNIQGDMAEVGAYKGEFSKYFNRYFPERKLYLFDTFEGFDSTRDKISEADSSWFKDTSVDIVLGYIFIHDFGCYHWPEVKKAVLDYCDNNRAVIVPIADRCRSVIISK